MIRFDWLMGIPRRLRSRTSYPVNRHPSSLHPVLVESLEPRQLLSAAAIPIGSQTQVNTTTTGDQTHPAVAMDSSGDYVVAWQSADGSGLGIYAQRYSKFGVAEGPEFQVNSMTTGDQSGPAVAMDAKGDFAVIWVSSDGSGLGVFARRYDASAVAQGTEFLVNTYTTNDQQHPGIAMDAAGDFVVAWQSTNQTQDSFFNTASAIYAQRFDSTGARVGSEFLVNTQTTGDYTAPSVAMNATGEFVIDWVTHDFDNFIDPFPHISAKRYGADGSVNVDLNEFGFGYHGQRDPSVAIDSTGNFVAAFWGYQDDNLDTPITGGVRAAIYSQSDINYSVNTYQTGNQSVPSVAVGGNGDFVITWQSNGPAQDGSGSGVYKQECDSAFNPVGVETRVNAYTMNEQVASTVAADAAGDYVVVWQSNGQDGSGWGIYSQQYFSAASTQNPMLLQIEGTPIDAIAPLSTPLTSALNVYDANNDNWTGATIAIAGNDQSNQDVLSFTNTANITGIWDPTMGTLTLSGTDTVSNYRAALRSITYHNTSNTPNTSLTRTITFQTRAGLMTSNTLSRDLNVHATSMPPAITGVDASVNYVSSTTPVTIAPNLVVTDPDGLLIQNATVSFVNWQGEDRVTFNNSLGLQHTFTQDLNAHTATLTITGSATAAQYQTLLRSVTYQDIAGNPNTSATRVATFTVFDPLHNGSASTNVTVSQYLAGVDAAVNFYRGSPPLALFPNLAIAPPPGLNIQSVTVSFTNWLNEDRLAFDNSLALQHSFIVDSNAHTATLTIVGSASASGYQMLLRSVTYQDVAGNPLPLTRVATLTVNDGTNAPSITENINVFRSKPPVVQVNDSSPLSYKVNSTAIAIMSKALVTDPDSKQLSSMTITISSGFLPGHDVLSFANKLGITAKFNAATGVLTLSGTSSVANYQAALRSVKFKTTGSGVSAGSRTFKVIATDASGVSSTPVTRDLTVTK